MLSIISNNLSELYPNMIIVLKVMVTVPITVVSAEQSLSKLKLLHKLPFIYDYSGEFFCGLCYQLRTEMQKNKTIMIQSVICF
jgi:hypothetical protein